MVNNYILFPKANDDLENIIRYVSIELTNPEAAMNLILRFEKKFNELSQFPQAYPTMENEQLIIKNLRKCVVDNFLVIYLHNEVLNLIEIVRVIYARQDYIEEL
ncbi:MAG: type II toxin-antitoxin system RelE/ParE family toxin [Firmicutes bacterium]|nr:type II toxin-antitoxin system RelE/ParE family toxin [Bacillota bacterium]